MEAPKRGVQFGKLSYFASRVVRVDSMFKCVLWIQTFLVENFTRGKVAFSCIKHQRVLPSAVRSFASATCRRDSSHARDESSIADVTGAFLAKTQLFEQREYSAWLMNIFHIIGRRFWCWVITEVPCKRSGWGKSREGRLRWCRAANNELKDGRWVSSTFQMEDQIFHWFFHRPILQEACKLRVSSTRSGASCDAGSTLLKSRWRLKLHLMWQPKLPKVGQGRSTDWRSKNLEMFFFEFVFWKCEVSIQVTARSKLTSKTLHPEDCFETRRRLTLAVSAVDSTCDLGLDKSSRSRGRSVQTTIWQFVAWVDGTQERRILDPAIWVPSRAQFLFPVEREKDIPHPRNSRGTVGLSREETYCVTIPFIPSLELSFFPQELMPDWCTKSCKFLRYLVVFGNPPPALPRPHEYEYIFVSKFATLVPNTYEYNEWPAILC